MSTIVAFRTGTGRFAPGQSGNPAGRPKGSRNRTTLLADALSEGQQEALVRKLVDDALAGDRVLLRFCVDRILGKPGHRTITLELAAGKENDPEAILAAAMRALADGEISPDEAVRIARAANTISRVRLGRVQEKYVAAGIRLRELAGEARLPSARVSSSSTNLRRRQTSADLRAEAAPENGLFSRGERHNLPGQLLAAAAEVRAGLPRSPDFSLLSRPTRRAALLGSVSPLGFVAPPSPETSLYPASAPCLDAPRLAA